jgi:hypothetical protein
MKPWSHWYTTVVPNTALASSVPDSIVAALVLFKDDVSQATAAQFV